MPHGTISSPGTSGFSSIVLRYATTSHQAERLELRMAELDLAHATETKRLNKLLVTAKKKLFSSGRQRD